MSTHFFIRSAWLRSAVAEETLHLLHVVWGMGVAFLISAALGWLYLQRSIAPYPEQLSVVGESPDRTAELRRHALWIVQLRWLAAVLAGILSFLATHVLRILDEALLLPLLSVVGLLLLTNLVFSRASRRSPNPYRVMVLQISSDLLLLTVLLHLSGGIENSLYVVYVFHVMIAAMLMSRRDSYFITTAAAVLVSAITFGEYGGIISHQAIHLTPHGAIDVHRESEHDDPEHEEPAGHEESVEEDGRVEVATEVHAEDVPPVAHPAHDMTFILGRLLPFLGLLYCLTYLIRIVVSHLRRRENQLSQSLRDTKRMEAQLVQAGKMAAIGELAGNFAHEVNNPVAIISGKAKILLDSYRDGELPDDVSDALRKIDLHADRIARITSGLLAFSRPSLGKKEILAVEDVVDRILELLEEQLEKAGIQVERQRGAEVPKVLGNHNELQQVLFNVVSNAIDAMSRGGHLTISTRASNVVTRDGHRRRVVRISVADTGVGMHDSMRKRIFEPFFTTKKEGRGTGLGLSISHGLVRSHGGRIDVRSVPGKGSTFVVTLPAATSSGEALDG